MNTPVPHIFEVCEYVPAKPRTIRKQPMLEQPALFDLYDQARQVQSCSIGFLVACAVEHNQLKFLWDFYVEHSPVSRIEWMTQLLTLRKEHHYCENNDASEMSDEWEPIKPIRNMRSAEDYADEVMEIGFGISQDIQSKMSKHMEPVHASKRRRQPAKAVTE